MSISPLHVIIVLILGVLFFGKNLPAVARQIGSALVEFRKGVNEWKDVYHRSPNGGKKKSDESNNEVELAEKFETLGTKFEPPIESSGK